MGAKIYIYIFPFSLYVSVYLYVSVCDFVCIALLLPFVIGFGPSVILGVFCFFVLTLKIFFHNTFFLNNYFLIFILKN